MKTFSLYVGYDNPEPIKKVEAVNHRQAASHFRNYVIEELGKTSLYGYVIRRDDLQEEYKREELVRVPYDLFVSKKDIASMKLGNDGTGYVSIEGISNREDYEQVSKHAFQPSVQIDNNTYNVTFIQK